MNEPVRLALSQTQLLVVDVQERLLPHIADHEEMLAQCLLAIRAAREMELPITVSEQYPEKLGPTAPDLARAAGDAPRVSKMTFSSMADAAARERLTARRRPTVLLIGIETHVCVQQTALDLLAARMTPVILADAVSSRRRADRDVALERMRSAGAVVTTVESALYELLHEAGTPLFRRILPLVR
ncbi:Isochorismatase family protein [Phycisphaerae bacterium RAS1]|nr:Isochorismatase family protein [Phycisphaerae bacterium RAS1]